MSEQIPNFNPIQTYSPEAFPELAKQVEPLLEKLTPDDLDLLSVKQRRDHIAILTRGSRNHILVRIGDFFCETDGGRPVSSVGALHESMPQNSYSITNGAYLIKSGENIFTATSLYETDSRGYEPLSVDLMEHGFTYDTNNPFALASVSDGLYVHAAALNTIIPGFAQVLIQSEDEGINDAMFGINDYGEVVAEPNPKKVFPVLRREI